MAWRLDVYIVNPDDEIVYVKHEFYGETKDGAEQVKKECSFVLPSRLALLSYVHRYQ